MDKFVLTTIVTVFLAISGYFAKYLNDVRVAKRRDKLDRVNRQLKEFYGPLLSLTSSSASTWAEFRKRYRSEKIAYFDSNQPPTEEEKETWRIWMSLVFVPINQKIYDLVINQGDLIIENEFPDCIKDLCAHVESYKPVLAAWEENDFREHVALINYPSGIADYALKSYEQLKQKQSKLIN